ncbi:MAG: YgjV family protein [Clostridia bacterium]|nr:YgjV family protein [Clostridia bacterium]
MKDAGKYGKIFFVSEYGNITISITVKYLPERFSPARRARLRPEVDPIEVVGILKEVIVGNICSIGAMITDSVSGTRKKHREIMAIQILSQVFYSAGSIILKGYSSTAQSLVAILRNLAAIRGVKHKAVEWILIALGVVLGVVWNNRGWLGLLPVVANLEYSVAVFRFKEKEKWLKLSFLINMLMYSVFSFVIMNYVGAAANIVVAVITAISLIRGIGKPQGGETDPPVRKETTDQTDEPT